MRHGNLDTVEGLKENIRQDSDPTYEAWKPTKKRKPRIGLNPHSDPTYEAWKPKLLLI